MTITSIIKDRLIKKIAKSTATILSGNSIASVLNLISFTIMANRVIPSSLAIFALAQTYVMILNDIFNVQTWESLVKFGATDLKQRKTLSLFKSHCIIDLLSAIVGTLLAILFIRPTSQFLGWDQTSVGVISLYSLTILFNLTSLTIGIPRIFNRFGSIAKIQIVAAVVKLCTIGGLSFFSNASSINSYIFIYLLTDVGANLATILFGISLLNHHFGVGWWREPAIIDKKHLVFIWWTNLRTILRIPVRHFDMVIIGSVMSLELVGVYRVYKEIAGIISRIGDPVNQAIFPEFARLINRGDNKEAIQAGKKTIILMAIICICIVLPLLLTSRLIVTHFFGPSYTGWIPALQVLIAFYGISFTLIPVNSLFIAAGFAKASFWVVVLTNIIYLLTAYLLGKEIGIYGIVIAFATQSLLNSGIKILILARSKQ